MSLSDAYCQSDSMDALSMEALENLWQIRIVLDCFNRQKFMCRKTDKKSRKP